MKNFISFFSLKYKLIGGILNLDNPAITSILNWNKPTLSEWFISDEFIYFLHQKLKTKVMLLTGKEIFLFQLVHNL
jgi:hypothetical protein